MNIRKAKCNDLSRVAEIYVLNNRIHFFPIFKDENYSFGELQVVSLIDNYFKKDEIIENLYVFDNGLIRGFILMNHTEIDIVNAFSVCVLTFCSCFIFNWIWMQNAKA